MTAKLENRKFAIALCKALDLDQTLVRRIVLDINIDCSIVAYVELNGNKKALDIIQTLRGVKFDVREIEEAKP